MGESVRAHGRRPRPEPRRRRAATENVHRDVVEDAKAVLSRRFHERLGLDDVATAVGTSPFHLARVFRRHTGSSLHAYRTQLRLRSALDALADPRRQVGGLALELGFASSSHFVDSFRAAFATTPTGDRRAVGRRDAQASPRLML